jgi:hypothetical protein
MKYLFLLSLLLLGSQLYAQNPDDYDIGLQYNRSPGENSDAAFQQYQLNAKLLTMPLQHGEKGILMLRGNYSFVQIDLKDELNFPDRLKNFHSTGLMIGYIKRLKNPQWTLTGILIPQLNSNFSENLSRNDFYLNAVLMFIYSSNPGSRLSIGLTYTSTLGFPAPIPIINYWKAWNDQWQMNIGFPRTGITHQLNAANKLVAFADLHGYNGNIGAPIADARFKKGRTARRISYFDIASGLEWQHKFKTCRLRFNASYSLSRQFELQTDDYDTAYEFDMKNGFNVGLGLDFNL